MRRYNDAEPLYILLSEITKSKSGENPDYASKLIDLGDLYETMENFSKAESIYLRTSEIFKQYLGDTSLRYAASLQFLGVVYFRTSQYNKAESALISSANIRKQQLGENSRPYAVSLSDLALVYTDLGEYTKAEALYLQCIEIDKKTIGENTSGYAADLNNLALLYSRMSNYNEAISLYLQSKEIRKKIFGEESSEFVVSLNNLASTYDDAGDYSNAEAMYLQALTITKKLFGEYTEDYAIALNGLGLLYEYMGLYNKAQPLLIQSADIRKKIFGEHSGDYAACLHNVAGVFTKQGDYDDAEKLYLRSLEIKKDIYGENHFSYASTLTKLAIVYKILHRFDKAEPLYIKAVEIKKKQLGEDHAEYGVALNDLAVLYDAKGDYDLAIKLYKQVFEIYKKHFGERHPNFAHLMGNLEMSYQKLGDFASAEPLLIQSNTLHQQILLSTLSILSEQDKQTFLTDNEYTFEIANSLLYTNHGGSGALKKSNLNIQLIFKSLSLSDSRNMLSAIRNSKDSSLRKLFEEWLGYKAVLARQYSLREEARIKGIDSIEKNADDLEKQLNRRSEEFKKQQNAMHITMEDIQRSLAPDEAAIEFVRFRLFDKDWTDSMIYAAYIFTKTDSFPTFIPLCEEGQLQKLFSSATKNTTVLVSSLYRGAAEDESNISISKGDSLYKLIWQPLEPYLKGISKISYSPAGKLYTVAFNALPAENKKILMDKYQLQQYTSTRQIALRKEDETTTPTSIALFGDAAFSMDSLQLVKNLRNQTDNITATNISLQQTRGSNNSVWNNLPGTATEVNKIQQLFMQNKASTKIFVKQQASEENLKVLSDNSPQILHIATHGFFLPEQQINKEKISNQLNTYSLATDPLLRSGLVLAGGNYAWSGNNPINGIEDGIATAYEISQLNLSKTELVVLSACETALGDIKGSEGVFGLQRSFKMAGVNKLIVSLWQVPDKETSELMTTFYSNWLNRKTIEQSFYVAQTEMRKKYSPFYWAAFVLVE
jgi:CHAT domain-containing protein/Flp pilus assembly protein TadD